MKKGLAVLGAVGAGAGVFLALKKRSKKTSQLNNSDSEPASAKREGSFGTTDSEPAIDDLGTGQAEAAHILKNIRDTAFESSDEKLALALGRPTEEIQEWTSGAGVVDGDVVMKARTLAIERGIHIE